MSMDDAKPALINVPSVLPEELAPSVSRMPVGLRMLRNQAVLVPLVVLVSRIVMVVMDVMRVRTKMSARNARIYTT